MGTYPQSKSLSKLASRTSPFIAQVYVNVFLKAASDVSHEGCSFFPHFNRPVTTTIFTLLENRVTAVAAAFCLVCGNPVSYVENGAEGSWWLT